jgi:hypothetical protein
MEGIYERRMAAMEGLEDTLVKLFADYSIKYGEMPKIETPADANAFLSARRELRDEFRKLDLNLDNVFAMMTRAIERANAAKQSKE